MDSETILDNGDAELFYSMGARDALSLYSDNSKTYRILFECGRAEAAERQRRAGVGEIVDKGYVRKVSHEFFAEMAREDSNSSVAVI